ncbi:MAG: ATP-binding protein [Cyanobacteria bacterium P01_D01_bin.73]
MFSLPQKLLGKLQRIWVFSSRKEVRNWRLGQKIAAGYVLAIALGASGSIAGLIITDHVQGLGVMAVGDAATQDRILGRLYQNLQNAHIALLQLKNFPEEKTQERRLLIQDVRQAIADSSQLVDELDQYLSRGESVWLVTPEEELLAKANQSLETLQAYAYYQFPDVFRSSVSSESQGTPLPTSQLSTADQATTLEKRLDQNAQNLLSLMTAVYSKLEQTEVDLEENQGVEKAIILWSLFISALVAGGIAIVVTEQITQPLISAAAVAERAAKTGEFNERVTPVVGDLHLETEVGILARSLDTLIDRVEARNQELANSAEQAKGQAEVLQRTLEELRRTQSQLVQTEKMSLLGQVAAGVAHEINNPVSFIYGNLIHVGKELKDLLALLALYESGETLQSAAVQELSRTVDVDFLQRDLPKLLQSMRSGAERIREIVLSLRIFTRLDEADLKVVDLNESIQSVVTILRSRLCYRDDRPAVRVVEEYGELPLVKCYASQFNQVILHLLNNALDSIDDVWQAVPRDNHQPRLKIRTEILPDGQALITVTDTGMGIEAENVPKVFEMFYTTKPAGKGTGMGLAIAHQVITEKHGGTITCTSKLGSGTTFTITLPTKAQTSANSQ